jgi:hypothetical protein
MVWWMLLIYPTIVEMLISTTRCYDSATVTRPKDGKPSDPLVSTNVERLMAVPDIICGFEGDNYTYSVFYILNFIFILAYIVILPLYVIQQMEQSKHLLSVDMEKRCMPIKIK